MPAALARSTRLAPRLGAVAASRLRGFRVLASPASRRVRAAALAPAAAASPLRARHHRAGFAAPGPRASPRVPSLRVGARAGDPARALGGHTAAVDDALRESYLDVASRPSRFEETSHGPPDVCAVLLQAMRVQWSHGYPNTPRGFPRLTHGFHEYPAGMQAAAADRILDLLPGDSLLDPFMGGGTSLVVALSRGREAFGVDVSPLAAFVAAHRTWRPDEGRATLEAMRAAAREVVEGTPEAAANVRAEEEARRRDRPPRADEEKPASSEKKPEAASAPLSSTSSVPRDWRPAQRALAAHLASGALDGAEAGVAGALWFCLSVALQRAQKNRGKKRRPYKKQRAKAAKRASEETETAASSPQIDAARAFEKVVDEYCDRLASLMEATPAGTPAAKTINADVRVASLPRRVDAVLTSPPYPGVYDYLSFARKVRAGSGAAIELDVAAGKAAARRNEEDEPANEGGERGGSPGDVAEEVDAEAKADDASPAPPRPVPADSRWVDGPEPPYRGTPRDRDEKAGGERARTRARKSKNVVVPGSEGYFGTAVPRDRSWPAAWTSGEIGARRALRSDPRAFAAAWEAEQMGWLGAVSRSLRVGGRAAIMVGDGANIDTRRSVIDAGKRAGLREVASVTMALSHEMSDGTVWNAARREHLVLLEKESDASEG